MSQLHLSINNEIVPVSYETVINSHLIKHMLNNINTAEKIMIPIPNRFVSVFNHYRDFLYGIGAKH